MTSNQRESLWVVCHCEVVVVIFHNVMFPLWEKADEIRHAAWGLLPGIFQPPTPFFLSFLHTHKLNIHLTLRQWRSALFVVPTDCLIGWALVKMCMSLGKCMQAAADVCVRRQCVQISVKPVCMRRACRPKWYHTAPLLPSSWTQITQSKMQWCHSSLSFLLSRPMCCGASNQTNVQRLGQLNGRNTRRLHALSSGSLG